MTHFELYLALRLQLNKTADEAREEVAALVSAVSKAEQGEHEPSDPYARAL